MADYWIKLYLEMLDDPKMATLPDHQYKAMIEFMLCAGRENKDGILPDIQSMSWLLRRSEEEIESELKFLESWKKTDDHPGMIMYLDGKWIVTNYKKRQAPVPGKERQAKFRKTLHSEEYSCNENVTNPLRNVTQIITDTESYTESETDTDHNPAATEINIFQLFEDEIGSLTPLVSDTLQDWEKEYSPEWVADAIKEAVKHNARNQKYIDKILKNRKAGITLQKAKNGEKSKDYYLKGQYSEFLSTGK